MQESSRSVTPAADLAAATYSLVFTDSAGDHDTLSSEHSSDPIQLPAGTWDLTVTGETDAGTAVSEGSKTGIEITDGSSIAVSIDMQLIAGQGDLELGVRVVPEVSIASDYSVEAQLAPVGGGEGTAVSLAYSADDNAFTGTTTPDSGYYSLVISLLDADSTAVAAAAPQAVLIAADAVTRGEFSFVQEDGSWIVEDGLVDGPVPPEAITIYYKSCSEPTIWMWEIEGTAITEDMGHNHPGPVMISEGGDWWSFEIPEQYYPLETDLGVQFDGGNTRDLAAPVEQSRWYDGQWYTENPDPPAAPALTVDPEGGWFAGDAPVAISISARARAEAAVTNLEYRIDGGSWQALAGSGELVEATVELSLPSDGTVALEARAANSVGTTTVGPFEYHQGVQPATDFSWDNVTVYFAMTDRFLNGDPNNDNSYGRPSADAWGSNVGTFHGGDIVGMTQKLNEGYFTDLGVTAIWITAPYEQVHGFVAGGSDKDFAHYSYHGYYSLDYTMIDRNIGTVEEFRSFVDTAHGQGIRVILDIVMNHSGYGTLADGAEYGFGTDLSLSDARDWAPGEGENWDSFNNPDGPMDYDDPAKWSGFWGGGWIRAGLPGGYTPAPDSEADPINGSLSGLPDFRTNETSSVGLSPLMQTKWAQESGADYADWRIPAADSLRQDTGEAPADYIVAWLAAWVEEFGIDGFRVDTAKHVEQWRWAELRQEANAALKSWRAANPAKPGADWTDDFWMTGEFWGYGVTEYDEHVSKGGAFDSVINFTYQGTGGGGPAYNDPAQMEATYSGYASSINSGGWNVLSYLSQHDTQLYTRSNLINGGTNLLLAPGGVQIFYGDETARPFGPTASDSHQGTRSFMNWGSENTQVLTHFQKLGQFRRDNIAVGAGQHQQISSSSGYAFTRVWNDNRVAVVTGAAGTVSVDVSSLWADGTAVRNAYDGSTAQVSGGNVSFDVGNNGVILVEINQ